MPETTHGRANDAKGDTPSIESLAKLCSVGAAPIPNDLPDDQQHTLLLAIAARRRKRLIHLFAAAIADDIQRDRQEQGSNHVETNI